MAHLAGAISKVVCWIDPVDSFRRRPDCRSMEVALMEVALMEVALMEVALMEVAEQSLAVPSLFR